MREASDLQVGGFEPFTTIDFPGRLSAVVFCSGCPWRCPYCHNPQLQSFHPPHRLPWERVRGELALRVGFLDGVVFSGGEPTMQAALPAAITEARQMGYAVGLHTAGPRPAVIERLIPSLNWVGLDIKAPLDARYDHITGVPRSFVPASESLQLLIDCGIPLQIRTTVDTRLLSEADLHDLDAQLASLGAPRTVRQECRPVTEARYR